MCTVIDETTEMRHHLFSLRREMRMWSVHMNYRCPILKWSIVHIRFQLLPFFFIYLFFSFLFFSFLFFFFWSGIILVHSDCTFLSDEFVHRCVLVVCMSFYAQWSTNNTGGWNQNACTFLYMRLVPKISWRCKTGSSTFVTLTSVNTCVIYFIQKQENMKCTVSNLQVNKVIDLDYEGANAPRSSKQIVPRLPGLPGSGARCARIP